MGNQSNPGDKGNQKDQSTERKDWDSERKDANPDTERKDFGEGNREADKQYRDATKRFIDEGGVDPAADEARRAMDDDKQRKDLEDAERIGRSRGSDHDSGVKKV